MNANEINVQNGKLIIELLTAVLRKFKDYSQSEGNHLILEYSVAPFFVNFRALGSK
jgi:hypothetical protein